jgi:hypothetical protein
MNMKALLDVFTVIAGVLLSPVALAAPLLIAAPAYIIFLKVGRNLCAHSNLRSVFIFMCVAPASVLCWIGAWTIAGWACVVFDISHELNLQIGIGIGSAMGVVLLWLPLAMHMSNHWDSHGFGLAGVNEKATTRDKSECPSNRGMKVGGV